MLKGEAQLDLVIAPKAARRRRGGADDNPVNDPLFEALRACRRTLADAADVPPYVIFHDSTLREMASERPTTMFALGRITGIGARKLDAYGAAFLAVLNDY